MITDHNKKIALMIMTKNDYNKKIATQKFITFITMKIHMTSRVQVQGHKIRLYFARTVRFYFFLVNSQSTVSISGKIGVNECSVVLIIIKD